MLGGSSQLNAMCYIRGQASDYDRWAELTGDEKFSYKNVLPYFKKSQNAIGYGDDEHNGRDGEIKVTKNNIDKLPYGELCKALIEAGRQHGHPIIDDPNGATQEGIVFKLLLWRNLVTVSSSTRKVQTIHPHCT